MIPEWLLWMAEDQSELRRMEMLAEKLRLEPVPLEPVPEEIPDQNRRQKAALDDYNASLGE